MSEKLAKQIEAKRKHICSSCDLSETEWAAIDSYNLGLTEAAEIVRRTGQSEWVPISEKQPEKDGFYTVTAKVFDKLRIVRRWEFSTKKAKWHVRKYWDEHVIAWMPQAPLPAPYQPKD
jgi:hypothetical protein